MIETCQQDTRRPQGKTGIDVIGGICWSCSFHCTSFCAPVMDSNNENELIQEMTLFISAWTDCKSSSKEQCFKQVTQNYNIVRPKNILSTKQVCLWIKPKYILNQELGQPAHFQRIPCYIFPFFLNKRKSRPFKIIGQEMFCFVLFPAFPIPGKYERLFMQ